MYWLYCSKCGVRVSTGLPDDVDVKAVIFCQECYDKSQELNNG